MSDASEQGQLQGANNSIQGIANLVGPFIFTLTFAWAIGSGKELAFYRRALRAVGGIPGDGRSARLACDAAAPLTD